MDYTWTAYVRDIFIILAAGTLVLASLYVGLVAWQVYRMAESLGTELRPILDSVENSARTVESTTDFLAGRFSSPANAAANSALGMLGLYHLYRQARATPPATPPGELAGGLPQGPTG
jgi:hypothetical protein